MNNTKSFQKPIIHGPPIILNLLSSPFISNSNQDFLGFFWISHYLGTTLDQGGRGGFILLLGGGHYTEPSGGLGGRAGAAGPRLPVTQISWQAQYTKPSGGRGGRVVAAGPQLPVV